MEQEKKTRSSVVWIAIIGVVIFLCLCAGLVSFSVGGYLYLREQEEAMQATISSVLSGEAAGPTAVASFVDSLTPQPTPESIAEEDDQPGGAVAAPEQATPRPTKEPRATPTSAPETAVSPITPSQQSLPPYTDIETIDLSLLYEVWNLVEQRFDGDLPAENVLLKALIEGSLSTLNDEYTRYITPEIAARLREDMGGTVSGIGAFVQENSDGLLQIVAPIAGQPADLAGILPGDIIVNVDGVNVVGMSFDEVLLMVRGPAGTQVRLEIVREGVEEPLVFVITRARFEVPVVEYELLESGIAYIRLLEFNQLANTKFEEALKDLLAQNPQGLILDLRNNPGGFLNQSVAIADFFLPDAVVLVERNNQGLDQVFRAEAGDLAEQIPLVVLVNRGSASASEIVAGALQDNGRATLIGETTFGKGSVQQVYTLSNGGELRVTIARWYTPNNLSISENGIVPDIAVEMSLEVRFGSAEDTQLQRAIEYLLTGE